jgi:DnaJ homolog subfamily C member 2
VAITAKQPVAAASDSASDSTSASSSVVDNWSNEQQKQLETGMREFPGSIPVKERWIKISEAVEGKSAKECYERFKEIVALLKKKQEEVGAAKAQ